MAPHVLKERANVSGMCRETALVAERPMKFLVRARVVADACTIATWVKEPGINTLMTNAAKAVYCAPAMSNMDVVYPQTNQCLREVYR